MKHKTIIWHAIKLVFSGIMVAVALYALFNTPSMMERITASEGPGMLDEAAGFTIVFLVIALLHNVYHTAKHSLNMIKRQLQRKAAQSAKV